MMKIATLGRGHAGRLALALLMLTLLPACSLLGRGEPTPPPLRPTVGGVTPRVAWSASIGSGGVGFQPVVVGEAVFAAAADGTVVRFEAGSGKVVWRVSVGQTLSAGVGASEAIAVVASRDGEVIALNAADGRQLWKVAAGTEVLSSPSVGLNTVLVRVGEKILALEAADGKTRWSWQRALPTLVLRQPSPVAIASMPTADGLVSLAFAGLPGGRLVALNLESGALRWEIAIAQPRGTNEIERISDVLGRPWIDGRQVCASAYQGRVACHDAVSGAPIWSRDLPAWSGLAVDPRFAFVADDRGNLLALRRETGEQVWRQEALSMRRLSQPLSSGGSVLIADRDGIVHWFSREAGTVQARRDLNGGPIQSPPIAAGNLAIVQTMRGSVFGLATD